MTVKCDAERKSYGYQKSRTKKKIGRGRNKYGGTKFP